MKGLKNIVSDHEFWFILLFNLFIIIGHIQNLISSDTVVWIYYFQSVIIGVGNMVRMGMLKNYTTENFQVNNQTVEPTSKTKWMTTLFFGFHYGFFHLIYFVFLVVITLGNGIKLDSRLVLINICIMCGNAIVSTWSRIMQDRAEKPNIGGLLFTPYLRIIPMHLFIILGFTNKIEPKIVIPIVGTLEVFFIFLILKIFSDLLMHIILNKTWRMKRPKPLEGYI